MLYKNKRVLGAILPDNKYKDELVRYSEFNNMLKDGFSQGLGIFEGNQLKDFWLFKTINTEPLAKSNFDKLNEIYNKGKKLDSTDVINIGVDKVKNETSNVLNELYKGGNEIYDYLKNIFNGPLNLFLIVVFVFVIIK